MIQGCWQQLSKDIMMATIVGQTGEVVLRFPFNRNRKNKIAYCIQLMINRIWP